MHRLFQAGYEKEEKNGRKENSVRDVWSDLPCGSCGQCAEERGARKACEPHCGSVPHFCAAVLHRRAAEGVGKGGDVWEEEEEAAPDQAPHICVAVREDKDLGELLSNVTIAGGGVRESVHAALEEKTPKRRAKNAASNTTTEAETNHTTRNSLWTTLRKIKAAATACGKGDEIVFRDPATDEEIAAVKKWIGRDKMPADIEDMLRHSNGVQIRCSGCRDAARSVPSTAEMLEIANYSSYTGSMIRRIGALPWLSVDCDFAYTVLEKRGSAVYVWMIDIECRRVTCDGTFSSILDQLLAFYVGLKEGGATTLELRTDPTPAQFRRRVCARLPRDNLW